MKKLESTLPNMLIVLTAIALISAAALAFTYGQTKPILDEQARQKQVQAVQDVLPGDFDNEPTEDAVTVDGFEGVEIYPARQGGALIGSAVRSVTGEGYGGTITVMVGFDPDGTITGTTVLSHTETPGLGAKLTEESFRSQFEGMTVGDGLMVEKDGGEVDAITAATISSRAFCAAVNNAWRAVQAAGGNS